MGKAYTFYVPNLVCGGCCKRLTRGLTQHLKDQGLRESDIVCEPLKQRIIVTLGQQGKISSHSLTERLRHIGFPAYLIRLDPAKKQREQRQFLKRLFVAGIGSMQVQMFSVAIYLQLDMPQAWIQTFHWFSLWLTTAVLAYAGKPFLVSAFTALVSRSVNMDVPVVLALGLAYLYSLWATWQGHTVVYFDSINMFLFFITAGRFLEWRARHHAQKATDALWAMVPEKAQKQLPNGGTQWVEVQTLKPGDLIKVAHGESIPADLHLVDGTASVDESLITGEARPVKKSAGECVYAGTLNLGAVMSGIVSQTAEDTRIGQIQRRLLQAQATRPRLAQWADQVAGYFTLALLIFSGLTAALWYWLDPSQVIPVTISVLIVTCPCALSLATPAALASVMARLATQGIVISRSDALERLLSVNHYVFDKTGTLTKGLFGLTDTALLGPLEKPQVLSLAAALEAGETHPIARAFSPWVDPKLEVSEKKIHPGLGLSGTVGGTHYWLGAPEGIRQQNPMLPPIPSTSDQLGATVIFLASERQWLAAFTLNDTLRPEATTVINRLKKRYKVTLLSGDNEAAVTQVTTELGIKDFQSRCLPEDKQSQIAQMMRTGDTVAMIGDGANDGPVLAQATVGIAMGSGTALAQASADIILLNPSLSSLERLEQAAYQTRAIIRQNMLWALGYNTLAVPFAAMGLVAPWLAAIGMSLSSVIVVSNSLRLLDKQERDR